MEHPSSLPADQRLEVPLARGGRQWRVLLGAGLVLLGMAAFLLAVLTGGTKVAGVDVPPAVAAVGGVGTAAIGALLLSWARGAAGERRAIWSDGDVLCLHAHAGPVLRVRAGDVAEVGPVRRPSSGSLRVAFGDQMFTVRSRVPVSRGVTEVPVGGRYVDADLEQVRDQLVAWVAQWR